jgi:hypothetical protein
LITVYRIGGKKQTVLKNDLINEEKAHRCDLSDHTCIIIMERKNKLSVTASDNSVAASGKP